jgi:hypothetical protein
VLGFPSGRFKKAASCRKAAQSFRRAAGSRAARFHFMSLINANRPGSSRRVASAELGFPLSSRKSFDAEHITS